MTRDCPTYNYWHDLRTDLRKPISWLDLGNMILRRFRLVLVREVGPDDQARWRLRRWLKLLDEIHEQGKCNVCVRVVEIIEKLMEEIFTLVFSTLAWAEAEGLSLNQANRQLEQAVCERYGLGREVLLGLVAGEALRRLEESREPS